MYYYGYMCCKMESHCGYLAEQYDFTLLLSCVSDALCNGDPMVIRLGLYPRKQWGFVCMILRV